MLPKNLPTSRLHVYLFLTLLLLLLALGAPYLVPHDPYLQNLDNALQAPSGAYPLGTDRYGRCVFSRVLIGGQTSIFSTLALVAIICSTGTLAGLWSGYYGGRLDSLFMRFADIFLAFPGLVFAIAIASVLGGGITNAIVALAVISWPKYARLVRSQVLLVKQQPYIAAARFSGCSDRQIIINHILPSVFSPLLVMAALDLGTMLIELAGLSFLGLGAQPPAAEWGSMMNSGRSMLQTAPWVILAPGAAIFLTVSCFNLLGDSLRDQLDPKHNPK